MPPRLTLLRGEGAGATSPSGPIQLRLLIDGIDCDPVPCEQLAEFQPDEEADQTVVDQTMDPYLAAVLGQLDLAFEGLDQPERARVAHRMKFNADGTIDVPPRLRLV